MPALLYCNTGDLSGASFSLEDEATIGRSPDNAVSIADHRISGRHARIFFDPEAGCYRLEDLGSRNGTQVDGVPVREATRLDALCVVTFAGRFDFVFQTVTPGVSSPMVGGAAAGEAKQTRAGGEAPSLPEVEQRSSEMEAPQTRAGGEAPALPDVETPQTRLRGDAPELPDLDAPQTRLRGDAPELPDLDAPQTQMGGDAPKLPDLDAPQTQMGGETPALPDLEIDAAAERREPMGSAAQRAAGFLLTVRPHEHDDLVFELDEGEHVVGRSEECDLQIEDASLSRKHALLLVSEGTVIVRDLGSKNGTFVDNEPLAGERRVTPANRLRFGFRVEAQLGHK